MKSDFSKIEDLFEVADKISNTDITEYKDSIIESLEHKAITELSTEEVAVKVMFDSFQETHEYFRHSLQVSKQVLAKIHENLMLYDEEMNPEMVMAFAALQKNINDSIKTISQSFKYLSEAKNNLKGKVEDFKSPSVKIENANIVIGASTRDALKDISTRTGRLLCPQE